VKAATSRQHDETVPVQTYRFEVTDAGPRFVCPGRVSRASYQSAFAISSDSTALTSRRSPRSRSPCLQTAHPVPRRAGRGPAQPSPWVRSCRARPVVSRCPIWTVRRGRPDRLPAAGIVGGSARRAGLFLGHAHITTTSRFVRSTPVRLAQALERMEAAAETLVDADDQPYLAAVR